MTMTLYHCINARSFRVLWMLEELGLSYVLKVLPFPPRSRDEQYLEVNPLGTIPAFLDGDVWMSESAAICQYLAARHSPHALDVGVDEADFGAYLNDLHFGEATLTFPQTLILRYGRFEPPERQLAQAVEDYTRWFLSRLRTLEPRLATRGAIHRGRRLGRLRADAGHGHWPAGPLQAGDAGVLAAAADATGLPACAGIPGARGARAGRFDRVRRVLGRPLIRVRSSRPVTCGCDDAASRIEWIFR